jgi:hypothetical protein
MRSVFFVLLSFFLSIEDTLGEDTYKKGFSIGNHHFIVKLIYNGDDEYVFDLEKLNPINDTAQVVSEKPNTPPDEVIDKDDQPVKEESPEVSKSSDSASFAGSDTTDLDSTQHQSINPTNEASNGSLKASFRIPVLNMELFVNKFKWTLVNSYQIDRKELDLSERTFLLQSIFLDVVGWMAIQSDRFGPIAAKMQLADSILIYENKITVIISDLALIKNNKTLNSIDSVFKYLNNTKDVKLTLNASKEKPVAFITKKGMKHYSLSEIENMKGRALMRNHKVKFSAGNGGVKNIPKGELLSLKKGYGDTLVAELKRKSIEVDTSKKYTVKDVQIEFRNGYIENIIALCIKDGKEIQFVNRVPIPVSIIRDVIKMSEVRLYNMDHDSRKNGGNYFIKLDDLLAYFPVLQSKRRDFSPADHSAHYTPIDDFKYILRKSPTKELFVAKAYVDLFGFIDENPNGLIQTEIVKQLNINNIRRPLLPNKPMMANYALFQDAYIFGTLSKIEGNNREFPVRTINFIENNQLRTFKYVSPVDLIRHQFFSLGVDLKVFQMNFNELKSTLDIGIKHQIGLTILKDSIRTITDNQITTTNELIKTTVATNQVAPNVTWTTQLDERYGIAVSYDLNFLFMRYDDFRLVRSFTNYESTGNRGGSPIIGMFGVNIWFKPASDIQLAKANAPDRGELFFRFNLHQNFAQKTERFFQVQLGYSFHIFKTTK